jgi:hypothetical protein
MTSVHTLLLVVVLLLFGCAPSMDPLYRDFERSDALPTDRTADRTVFEAALREAGWTPLPLEAGPAVATAPRTHARWGIYNVVVTLEVLPLGHNHVRVLIHPYREYAWGTRSKLPYLTAPLRRRFIPQLERAFETHGLTMITPERRGTR